MIATAPRFVSEVSSNHNRDLERCFAFIDRSAEIGCDAVKFQLFKVDRLFAPGILAQRPELREREAWELPVDFLPALADRCSERRVEFCCTPFYLDAVAELEPYVGFFKIASYELLWDDLLVGCAATGKPVVLSTGMATLDEVRHAVSALRSAGCDDVTLLHCVSGYPADPADCNLNALETLRRELGTKVGWSDHSVQPGVLLRAIHRWGAEFIEFHLDLDGTGDEFKSGHCWLPDQIAGVINAVKVGLLTDGSGQKKPAASEMTEREWRADPADGLRPLRHHRPVAVAP
jgi:N-acetylneuraminate synthase